MHRRPLERRECIAISAGEMPHSASTDYYSLFEAELQEILRHKYLASEKSGHDIGFERALKEWGDHHRKAWLERQGIGGKEK